MAEPKFPRKALRRLCCIAFLLLSVCSARAHASQCDAPPYGDTQQNYSAVLDEFMRAAKSEPSLPPNMLTGMMQATMQEACEAKFSGGDRTKFHKAGLTDLHIGSTGTAALTREWFASRNRALAHEESGKQVSDCSRPPYGDTVTRFKAFTARYQATDATSLISILEMTCRAKFGGGDRKALYTVGLTDQEINTTSTATLAATWMNTTVRALGVDRPLVAGKIGSTEDYKAIGVREFVVDGPQLSSRHGKVRFSGAYILQGSVAMLYTDSQAVMMTRYNPQAGSLPSVALLTDEASHQLRDILVSCDSNPATAQIGCQIAIRGRATTCTLNNAFGATREVPCVTVEDGGYSQPSGTAQ